MADWSLGPNHPLYGKTAPLGPAPLRVQASDRATTGYHCSMCGAEKTAGRARCTNGCQPTRQIPASKARPPKMARLTTEELTGIPVRELPQRRLG